MPYSAKILKDSLAPSGKRLTTFELTYPRFVHAELMTHRLFSRNAASSRAIPIEKMIAQVMDDPALPKWWGKNQSGMQAREELTGGALEAAQREWFRARNSAVEHVKLLSNLGLHKQLTNRLLEPWMFITVLVSSTNYENWFHLRDHTDAQPEIAFIARAMHQLYDTAQPDVLVEGEWHLPLISFDDEIEVTKERDRGDQFELPIAERLCKISTGRCARVTHLTHDGKRDLGADVGLHDRLADSGHWSPFEHVAQALATPTWSGNFCGWKQYRKTFATEHQGDAP